MARLEDPRAAPSDIGKCPSAFLANAGKVVDAILGGSQIQIFLAAVRAPAEHRQRVIPGDIKDIPLPDDQRTTDRCSMRKRASRKLPPANWLPISAPFR